MILLILSFLIAYNPSGICASDICCHDETKSVVEVSPQEDHKCCHGNTDLSETSSDSHKHHHDSDSCHCSVGISVFAFICNKQKLALITFMENELNSTVKRLLDRPFSSIWIPPNI